MQKSLSFSRKESLKSKKLIKELFEKGSSFFLYPLKIFYLLSEEQDNYSPPAILISVSKRNFKRAVDRNLIKRQLREAYRTNKPELLNKIPTSGFPVAIGIMYVSKEKLPFNLIGNKLILAFDRFQKA